MASIHTGAPYESRGRMAPGGMGLTDLAQDGTSGRIL